ncbi:hypothetical protein RR42_s2395 [Cupriavidus basilensis]|uniref:Uncharacterized protein n=1 Tax=Cupriavidus basilensis TaxID=68895 RepID=A0A0C4YE46_9BURK|nr:hypothetical protein RR42_s2395 [Cupriavidus basilensis]
MFLHANLDLKMPVGSPPAMPGGLARKIKQETRRAAPLQGCSPVRAHVPGQYSVPARALRAAPYRAVPLYSRLPLCALLCAVDYARRCAPHRYCFLYRPC